MSVVWGALGALVGGVYAWIVCRNLRERAYRHEEERDWALRPLAPVVIPFTALLAGALALRAPALGLFTLVPMAVLAVSVPLGLVDLDVRRLPDRWLLPAIPAMLALAGLVAAVRGEWAPFVRVLWLVPVVLLVFFVLFFAGGGTGFGFGDVKLSALLAIPLAWLGGRYVVSGLMLPFVLGGVVALVLIQAGLADRKTAIPFGPFMIVGALIVVALPARMVPELF